MGSCSNCAMGTARHAEEVLFLRCNTPSRPPVLCLAHCASLCCFPAPSLCCVPARTHRAGQAGRDAAVSTAWRATRYFLRCSSPSLSSCIPDSHGSTRRMWQRQHCMESDSRHFLSCSLPSLSAYLMAYGSVADRCTSKLCRTNSVKLSAHRRCG